MSEVVCSVCGEEVGQGPQGLGIKRHSGMHRREFRERFGRDPEDYQEVRDVLGNGEWPDDVSIPTGPNGVALFDSRVPYAPLSRFVEEDDP